MSDYKKFEVSRNRWKEWRKQLTKELGEDPFRGLCLWEKNFDRFKLECWIFQGNATIFQFFEGGNGFEVYQPSYDAMELIKDLLPVVEQIRSQLHDKHTLRENSASNKVSGLSTFERGIYDTLNNILEKHKRVIQSGILKGVIQ